MALLLRHVRLRQAQGCDTRGRRGAGRCGPGRDDLRSCDQRCLLHVDHPSVERLQPVPAVRLLQCVGVRHRSHEEFLELWHELPMIDRTTLAMVVIGSSLASRRVSRSPRHRVRRDDAAYDARRR